MAEQFAIGTTLPATGDREDIYETLKTLLPTSALVDEDTLKVQAGKIVLLSGIPRWEKYTLGFADFTSAAVAESVTLLSLPATGIVQRVITNVTEAWLISGMSTLDIQIGITGTLGKYADHADAESTGIEGFEPAATLAPESMAGATNILATATSDSGNLSTATAGSIDVYVLRSDLINT